MSKLWQKDYELNKQVEEFEVGADKYLDNNLVRQDVYGSIAHAKMLESIGIIAPAEFAALKAALSEILALEAKGDFLLSEGDEDVHSKVENYLIQKTGDAGKKIHTARSRNDQVLVDLRLYCKEKLLEINDAAAALAVALAEFAEDNKEVPMPGYTHMQRAMVSSAALWAAAFAESMADNLVLLDAAYRLNDQSPLGSAAAYGVSLDINRQMVSDLLGFGKVQNNVLYCQNSRGKIDGAILQALTQIMLDLSRLAQDILLFTTAEFGFFHISDELLTGSSIMPQKKNVDIMELVRAKAKIMLGYQDQMLNIALALPSGYNRDLQETKAPLMAGLDLALSCLKITTLTIRNLEPDQDRLAAACTPDLFAAEKAYDLVRQGMPFRDAYREVAKSLASLEGENPAEAIQKKAHLGGTANLGLEALRARLETAVEENESRRQSFEQALERLKEL
jgi:argininosuccinate lyase